MNELFEKNMAELLVFCLVIVVFAWCGILRLSRSKPEEERNREELQRDRVKKAS